MTDNISPAPWRVVQLIGGSVVVDSNGDSVANTWFVDDPTPGQGRADAEGIVLLRNAADVQARRGWMAMRFPSGWCAMEGTSSSNGNTITSPCPIKPTPDPASCLVEADKWYRENVEASAEKLRTHFHGVGNVWVEEREIP